MIYLGFFLVALGIYLTMLMETMSMAYFFVPSAIASVVLCPAGAILVSYRPGQVFSAVSAFFSKEAQTPKEELRLGAKIFSLLSRYALAAGGIYSILGGIHVLSARETIVNVGGVALGLSFVLAGPLLGIILSSFVFDPMKTRLERMASLEGAGRQII